MSGTMKSRASVAIAVVVSALVFVSIGGAAPPGTQTQAAEAAACAALYGVPAAAAPDPLASCQWDMRAIGATPSGSYAVNQGHGSAAPRRRRAARGMGAGKRGSGERDGRRTFAGAGVHGERHASVAGALRGPVDGGVVLRAIVTVPSARAAAWSELVFGTAPAAYWPGSGSGSAGGWASAGPPGADEEDGDRGGGEQS